MAKILNNQRRLSFSNQSGLPDFLRSDNDYDVYYFNSGREAIYAFLTENYSIPGTVLLPAYLPEGIYVPFKKLNWTIHFYDLNKDGTCDPDSVINILDKTSIDIFMLIHLFGIPNINLSLIARLKSKKVLIIEDLAHALGSELINSSFGKTGELILYSPGKMIGVPSAGILKHKKDKNIHLPKGRKNVLWFIFNGFSILFLVFSTWLQKSPLWLCKLITPFYKVSGAVSYKILMGNFTNQTTLADFSKRLLRKTDYMWQVNKRLEMISYYLKHLRQDLFEFFITDFQSNYVMMGFPVYIKGDRQAFINHLKKFNVYGLVLTGGWLFLSEEEKKKFPVTMNIYKTHFLFPLNPFHTKEDLEKIVQIANSWEN